MWDDSCQLAFITLKDALIHAPILQYPDFSPASKQFQLYTDVSANNVATLLHIPVEHCQNQKRTTVTVSYKRNV